MVVVVHVDSNYSMFVSMMVDHHHQLMNMFQIMMGTLRKKTQKFESVKDKKKMSILHHKYIEE